MPQPVLTPAAPSVTHSTFTIERSYPVSPARVFAAFADPAKKRSWYGAGRDFEHFSMDFRVGGCDHSQSRLGEDTPIPGAVLSNTITYQDIVPDRRIVMAYTMAIGDHRISASLATVELLPSEKGTDLIFTEQSAFFEGADGAAIRKDGWSRLLACLANEFEN